jgi:hypothetical protein
MEVSGQLHTPPALPPGKSPWYPLGRRLSGLTGLDSVVRRKIPSPCRDSKPRLFSPYDSAIPLSYSSYRYVQKQNWILVYMEHIYFLFLAIKFNLIGKKR